MLHGLHQAGIQTHLGVDHPPGPSLCPQPSLWSALATGEGFTNVSRALQNILSKFVHYKNLYFLYKNFKLKLCTCAQRRALGMPTKFQL